ncbi:MAG: class I tRNA ligase family protein, partial [Bacteroidales bacterium]|nr:class I tRNA ligase family protein [Bacteroidales bacterium]
FKNTYKHWMENVKDWCISRQLWWGQQIPAFYISGTNEFVVAENVEDALSLAKQKTGNINLQLSDLKQDDDVLDTWFSSWLWPISVFDGIRNPNNQAITYYYPTNVLVTAPDILFFWVARMIIAGFEYRNEKPFNDVYLTGMVRDKLGRKMSKSLGNSPDPLNLIDKYGADGVRVGMLLCSAAGNDLLFDESLTEQGRNFGNKIWNAFRLIKSWKVDESLEQPEYCKKAIEWFNAILHYSLHNLEDNYLKYRLSDALMIAYKLFWDEFSSWYLESIKPAYQQPIDKDTMAATIDFFDSLLKILHPFMPFITEELWQALYNRQKGDSIMISNMPKGDIFEKRVIEDFELVKEAISDIRLIRKEKNIAQKDQLTVKVFGAGEVYCNDYKSILLKLCNLSDISFTEKKVQNAVSFRIQSTEFFVPLSENINFEEEIKKLEEELKYAEGFLKSVMMKLRNDKFVNNAPAKVIELEKKKQADAEEKIKLLKERLAGLK